MERATFLRFRAQLEITREECFPKTRVAKLFVEAMRIARGEHLPDMDDFRMIDDRLHQCPAQAGAAVRVVQDHVTDPGKGKTIGDGARKADLRAPQVRSHAKGTGEGFFDYLPRAFPSPIGGVEQSLDGIE